jgi:Bacterial protein of unknown function (DUF899)
VPAPAAPGLADGLDGTVVHLNHRDVTLICLSRAPIERLTAYKQRMGWQFPYVSTYGSDFAFDFGLAMTEEQAQRIPEVTELAGQQARAAVHILSTGPGCAGKHRRLGQPLARWPGRRSVAVLTPRPLRGIPPTALRTAPLPRPGNVNQRDKRPRPSAYRAQPTSQVQHTPLTHS